jgi:putative ABC transport system substrate-binding protein
MRRREFIAGLGASAWPMGTRAQQGERMRRIAMLVAAPEDDPEGRAELGGLLEELARRGWIEGHNLRIDLRFGARDPDRIRDYAAELVGLMPNVIFAISGTGTRALQQQTLTIPIVFMGPDPLGAGLVRNVARPEGNITGFSVYEPSIAGKWLELLKDAVPHLARVAIVFNPDLTVNASRYLSPIKEVASTLRVQAMDMAVRDTVEMVHAIDAFGAEPNGGILVLPPPLSTSVRNAILKLAQQHRLPAIYPGTADIAAGGLLAYASDRVDLTRRAAFYVDRLLRGANISELPVQFPTRFELVINLKTAKALGLAIPEALLLRADKLIE